MTRFTVALLLTLMVALPATAQETCPAVHGITCDGAVTDLANVVNDDERLEAAVASMVANTGHEMAVVIVGESPNGDPRDLAEDIGNGWGVGDPQTDDGVVVVVDLGARRTEIVTGPGASLRNLDFISSVGNSFFGNGDFDGGISAIIGAIEASFADPVAGRTNDEAFEPAPQPPSAGVPWWIFVLAAAGFVTMPAVFTVRMVNRAKRALSAETAQERRKMLVDLELDRLDPTGSEMVALDDVLLPQPSLKESVPTHSALTALRSIAEEHPSDDSVSAQALWALDVIDVLDSDRLAEMMSMPLDLSISNEQELLEDAVQESAAQALQEKDDAARDVKLAEVGRLVQSLRPYRVAEARQRLTRELAYSAVVSSVGPVVVTDLGQRFLQAASIFEPDSPIEASVHELAGAYVVAKEKTDRLERVHARLSASTARGAVAVALTDVGPDIDDVLVQYEAVISALEGSAVADDGLSVAAIAAFLLMNHDEESVEEFLDAYRTARQDSPPGLAVELALAGVSTKTEAKEARKVARELGIPVAIGVALSRHGARAVENYEALNVQLIEEGGVSKDNRKTIAALLAIGLEPAVAVGKWRDVRGALGILGLQGSYADVAAAFGASDPRGPRQFALAYAAQRQALERSAIDDADRYAPELAHAGTNGQRDSITGERLPRSLRSFDPYTFLYYHWVITGGTGYGGGWSPVYRDKSWSSDTDSWFSGGGGFGGGASGGSSWGSSGSGGSSFGGFSGGGSFGGGSSGGSGW